MKKYLKILIAVIIILPILGGIGFYLLIRSIPPMPTIEIQSIDLKDIRDGSYTGEYQGGMIKVTVKVDVSDHKISTVKIEKHECGLGKKAEKITQEIIKSQSLDVDVISGATHSSNAILKAVEVALQKGKQ